VYYIGSKGDSGDLGDEFYIASQLSRARTIDRARAREIGFR